MHLLATTYYYLCPEKHITMGYVPNEVARCTIQEDERRDKGTEQKRAAVRHQFSVLILVLKKQRKSRP
jgi:hypothetical protein